MTDRDINRPDMEPGYVFHDVHAEGMADTLTKAPVYKKFGEVKARVAETSEEIVTMMQGKEETRNITKPGDYVVTGAEGEEYVVGAPKFEARYAPVVGKPGVFEAVGKIRATDNPYRQRIAIVPSWGGYQYGEPDCKIATTVDLGTEEPNDPRDIYIIDRAAFNQTYKLR